MISSTAVGDREAEAFAANAYQRILPIMVVLLAIATPVLWVRYGRGMALSFVIGGAISLINFYWLKRTLAALIEAVAAKGKTRSPAGVLLRFVLRYVLIALAAYAIFKSSDMSMVGLCAGLSLPVGAVLIEAAYALYGALRQGF